MADSKGNMSGEGGGLTLAELASQHMRDTAGGGLGVLGLGLGSGGKLSELAAAAADVQGGVVSSLLSGLVIADADIDGVCGDYDDDDDGCSSNDSSRLPDAAAESVPYDNHLSRIEHPVSPSQPSAFSLTLCSGTRRHTPPSPPQTFSIIDAVVTRRERMAGADPGGAAAAAQYFHDFRDPSPGEAKRSLQRGFHSRLPLPPANKEQQCLRVRRYVRREAERLTSKRERTRMYVTFPSQHGRHRFRFDSRAYWSAQAAALDQSYDDGRNDFMDEA